jgi:hypothetical protein
MEEILQTEDEVYASQLLRYADFPHTKFFTHLFDGTTFFLNKEFDNAITEWERATRIQLDAKSVRKMPGTGSFQSSLDDVPLVGLLYALCFNAQTGVAIIRQEYAYNEVLFKEGLVVFARTSKSEEKLGKFLLKSGLISPSHLEEMAAYAKKEGVKLGRFLVRQGLCTQEDIHELLESQIKNILCDLFSWKQGDFYFYEKEVDEEDIVVHYTPLEVALLAARRAFDFSTFKRMIPNKKVIFRIPPYIERDKAKVVKELDANERFIFSLIDGNRNVEQLIKFGGDDEISTMNILYHLVLLGFIKKTKDIGVYADREFEEISTFLGTFFRVFRLLANDLKKELGLKAQEVLYKAREGLREEYGKIFEGISMNGDILFDTNKILKNISLYYPDPSHRLIFIDCFYELINGVIEEMTRILGIPITKQVITEIDKIRSDIFHYYSDSLTKRRVLEALDKFVNQFPE